MGTHKFGSLEKKGFQTAIDGMAGEGEAKVYEDGSNFLIIFKSERAYTIDKDGNITDMQTNYKFPSRKLVEQLNDSKYGTMSDPYEINCIEDLVDLSYQVNGIEVVDGSLSISSTYNKFSEKYIILNRNLNFASELSYENANRVDYGDINSNGSIETLITELTTGKGWIPIGGYKGSKNIWGIDGNFNGNGKEISNMYINNTEETSVQGLFGQVCNTTINDLGVSGNVYCNSSNVGGIIGIGNNQLININNCYFDGKIENINTSGRTGGILGNEINATINIYNCYSKGTIIGHNTDGGNTSTGGIIGYSSNVNNSEVKITDSYNEAIIIGESKVGGILGQGNGSSTKIYNCYNKGEITGNSSAGGIVGYTANYIERCYNTGKITSTGNDAGGIAGTIYAASDEKIYQCYNIGVVEGISHIGGILGYIYSASNLTIEQCYNNGEITGTNKTAGIVGSIGGKNSKILNCYNTGKITGTAIGGISRVFSVANGDTAKIISCYNIGTLDATSKIGVSERGVVNNSYYLSTCGATDIIATSVETDVLKGLASILDKSFTIDDTENIVTISETELQDVWVEDTESKNNGYPILKWQLE